MGGATFLVGGSTAAVVDFADAVAARLPAFIGVVVGLSMDYEVFLLARMHEAWRTRPDPAAAITEGMATTGRVVTAAAAIMVVVFGAFLLSPDRMLRQFGLGLAVDP